MRHIRSWRWSRDETWLLFDSVHKMAGAANGAGVVPATESGV